MDINQVPDQVWKDVITGKIDCDYEFLAVKILLSRLKMMTKLNSSEETVIKGVEELKNLFIKTQNIPNAQKDLKKILGKGGI